MSPVWVWGRLLAALLVGSGCQHAGVVESPRLVQLAVAPTDTTIDPLDSLRLRVSGQWSDGRTTTPPVTWSADGGTVDPAGLYRALVAPGAYQVTARQMGGSLQASARVNVRPAQPQITRLTISPQAVTLQAGQTQQFAATGWLSDGTSTSVSVAFSTTGGSISTGGLYTAPAAAGGYLVFARQPGGPLADSATVTVTAPGGSGLPNECASPKAGWIWCDDFDQNRLASYFEFDDAKGSFALVAGVGSGGSSGMRARFAKGQVSAGSLKLAFGRTPAVTFRAVDGGTKDHRELYWRWYLRNQPGWTGGGGDKLSRMTVFATGNWAQAMIAHLWSGGSSDRNLLVLDPASGTDVLGNLRTTVYNDFANFRWLGAVRGGTPLFDASHVGSWYCIESRVRLNDAGQANGVFEFWVNGSLDGRAANLNWLGSYTGYGLNAVFLENYWNAGSPAAQERYFDNFVVSTQRIGC